MKIHVRRRHIERGERAMSGSCPIALAVWDVANIPARVSSKCCKIDDAIFYLSRSAQRFIARFDAGKPVKPFAFVLK